MKINTIPDGIWPVMITPLDDEENIDYEALQILINWYESAGVHGLFANCLSSEMYELAREERIELTRFVVEHSRVPVLSTGTFYKSIEENAEFIREIYATGVDAVVLITGLLAERNQSDEELLEAILDISDLTEGIPLGLYECPVPYKRLLSPEMIARLSRTGRFVYMKDTSCEADVVVSKINAAENSNLKIFNAHTPDCLHSIRHQGAGISPIGANFYPELYTYLWNEGRNAIVPDAVAEVEEFLIRNDGIVHHKYPLSAKYFLALRGLPVNVNTRKSVDALDESDKQKIRVQWEHFRDLAGRLGWIDVAV